MMLNIGFEIDADELVTGRTCVIAQSGAGKSYAIGVILEELLKKNIAFCIVDPEGEYKSLKEKFSILWIGGEEADVKLEETNISDLALKSVKENIPIVFDLSETLDENVKVKELFESLYQTSSKLKIPYLLLIEEVDKYAPQSSKNMVSGLLEIAKRGRKRGLGLLIASQRPAFVNKNLLSQCGSQFIGKLTIRNDIDAVRFFFEDRKNLLKLPDLDRGRFFAMGDVTKNKTLLVKIKKRVTRHVGYTPKIGERSSPKIEEVKKNVGRAGVELKDEGALKVRLSKEELVKIVEKKRKRRFKLFGKKVEEMGVIKLVYEPLVRVGLRLIKRSLTGKRKFEDVVLVLDGLTGCFVHGDDRVCGVKNLLGLTSIQIRVMLEFGKSKKDLSVNDLVDKTELNENVIRDVLKQLRSRRLVTVTGKKGRANHYSPLNKFKVPKIKSLKQGFESETKKMKGEKVLPKIKEEDVRELIKGFTPDSEVMSYQVVYKPFYTVSLNGKKKRVVKVDASKN
ncbi:MAG: DUF87 domain-containing protein [Nanoarchaeota archaeon]|nr:DUF87 domain-containing protein [Nanoarchaeota archaeon]